MKGKRFIFTIDPDSDSFLEDQARKQGVSKSKILKSIINNHTKPQETSSDIKKYFLADQRNELEEKIKNLLFEKSFIQVVELLRKSDFNILVTEADLDFLLYAITELIELYPNNHDLFLLYAKILKHKGYYKSAIDILENVNLEDNFYRFLTITQIKISQGKINEAFRYLQKSQIALNTSDNSLDYNLRFQDFTITKAEFIWICEGVHKAFYFVDQVLGSSNMFSNNYKGKLYCLMGEFTRDKGDYDNAEIYYKNGLRLLINTYESNFISRIYKGLGSIYKNRNELSKASEYTFKAYELSKDFKDAGLVSSVLASLGSLYQAKNQLELADYTFNEKYKLAENMDSLRESFYASYDLAVSSISQGDINEASTIISRTKENAKLFKRKYYFDIWEGYIKTFNDMEEGIAMIKQSKTDAQDHFEEKRAQIADYALGAVYFRTNIEQGKKIFSKMLTDTSISKQIKLGINDILHGNLHIKPI